MDETTRTNSQLREKLAALSHAPEDNSRDLSIVLAAGHGKRIKSSASKMLHEIWGVPTVVRVAAAARRGLESENQVVVLGIKAGEVAAALGGSQNRILVLQAPQNGTGHAVQVALEKVNAEYAGDTYIFPGDMGLLSAADIREFKQVFSGSGCDMMVLTGLYSGAVEDNYYGRILRVPEKDVEGRLSGTDAGKVIEIKEHRDILALGPDQLYEVSYRGRRYNFSRQQLLENREFNSGVFAFKTKRLRGYVGKIETDNAQAELYLTDLIAIFNQNGLAVGALAASDDRAVLGFNTKSVLREMNDIARERVYQKLKNIVSIDDPSDFFVADEVVEQIIELDATRSPIDLRLGKGAHLGSGARVSVGLTLDRGATVRGNVTFGDNCALGPGVVVSGTDEFPTQLGDSVRISGRSEIAGCTIEAGVQLEHCILGNKRVKRIETGDGSILPVRCVMMSAEGLEAVSELE